MVCVDGNYTYLFEISNCDLVLTALSHLDLSSLSRFTENREEKRKEKDGLAFY